MEKKIEKQQKRKKKINNNNPICLKLVFDRDM